MRETKRESLSIVGLFLSLSLSLHLSVEEVLQNKNPFSSLHSRTELPSPTNNHKWNCSCCRYKAIFPPTAAATKGSFPSAASHDLFTSLWRSETNKELRQLRNKERRFLSLSLSLHLYCLSLSLFHPRLNYFLLLFCLWGYREDDERDASSPRQRQTDTERPSRQAFLLIYDSYLVYEVLRTVEESL